MGQIGVRLGIARETVGMSVGNSWDMLRSHLGQSGKARVTDGTNWGEVGYS